LEDKNALIIIQMTGVKHYTFLNIINYPTYFDLNIINPKAVRVTKCLSLFAHY